VSAEDGATGVVDCRVGIRSRLEGDENHEGHEAHEGLATQPQGLFRSSGDLQPGGGESQGSLLATPFVRLVAFVVLSGRQKEPAVVVSAASLTAPRVGRDPFGTFVGD